MSGESLLVVLPHPGEARALQATGHTAFQTSWEGRFLALRPVACLDCGETFQAHSLVSAAGLGCSAILGGGALVGVAIGVLSESFPAGVAVGLASWSLLPWVVQGFLTWLVRLRHPDRLRQADSRNLCPRCRSTRYVDVGPATRRLKCPACGAATGLLVETAGVS